MGSEKLMNNAQYTRHSLINTGRKPRLILNLWASMRLPLAVSALLIALVVESAPAFSHQEPPTLDYNRPDTGQISDANPQVEWSVLPASKDRVTISVDRTSDTLVPQLELLDEQNNVIAEANQDSTYAHASITNFTFPAPGHYIVRVRRYRGQAGVTHGTYKVLVSLLGTGEDGFNPAAAEGEIQLGQPRDGTLAEGKWQESWAFKTKDNTPLTITVSRGRGTLVPVVQLFDSTWKQVASAQPDASFASAVISGFVPSGAGQYYVTVSRIDRANGGTTGDYHLVVVQG